MGSSSSRLAKKISSSFIPSSNNTEVNSDVCEQSSSKPRHRLVFSRRGSMYEDEDGDLAHEFYVEVPSLDKRHATTMQRIYDNLTPQGEVYYDIARLHVDFPYIIANL